MIADTLPPFDFGRVAAQSAKQVIVQKVRDAERDRQYEEYKDRIGEIVNGVVKRVEYGNVIVDLGRGEGIVRRDELIPRETFRPGDRLRSYLFDVRRETRGPQIFLSRTHPQFMAKLFAQEVPEIYDCIVEVKAVARDPGSRAKIAVTSRDSSIDPVGACVGMRGSRVQAVVGELQGEKIDIIPWSSDQATFIVNALQPAEVVKVVLDEDADRIEVVVPDDQLSLAIGRRGQNVRLASQLTGWDIDILTEQEESERRQKEFAQRTELFMQALDVDEVVGPAPGLGRLPLGRGARLCRGRGARVHPGLRRGHGGRDPAAGAGIPRPDRGRAGRAAPGARRRRRAREIDGVTTPMLVAFGENEVKTVEDLAGCATDDLVGWSEGRGAEVVRHKGILDGFDIPRADAEASSWPPASRPAGSSRRPRPRARPRSLRDRSAPDLSADPRSHGRAPRAGAHLHRQPQGSPPAEMIRFVLGPDGTVVADLRRAPARPRRLGRRPSVPRSTRPCGGGCSTGPSGRPTRRPRRPSGRRSRRRSGSTCAKRWRSPTRRERSSPASRRSKPRSPRRRSRR